MYASTSTTFVKNIFVHPTSTALQFTLDDVSIMLLNLFISGKLIPDENAIYAFIFRGDSIVTDPIYGNWLQTWCGIHFTRFLNGYLPIKYFILGDTTSTTNLVNAARCQSVTSKSVNSNVGADSVVNVYAHEMVETVTNAYNAWVFDSNGYENADDCAWNFGDLKGKNYNYKFGDKNFLVQLNYKPTVGCV